MSPSDHAIGAPPIVRHRPIPGISRIENRPVLSGRERQVLLAWLRSDSKVDAASDLFISVGTMNTHLTRIRTKYAAVGRPASTKASLLARALQDGLTVLDEW